MRMHAMKRAVGILIGCSLLLGFLAGTGAAATLTVGSASGTVGDTVTVPVDLTGLSPDQLWSYELRMSWSAGYAQFAGMSTAGTLSSGWSVNSSSSPNSATIVGAGGTAIVGDGTLVQLQFTLGPGATTITLQLSSATLNEGSPTPTLVNGLLSISPLPTINVYPDTGVLAVGDSLQFFTSGGTPPYTYTSSDPLVADFTGSDDWLHALGPGSVQVTSQDSGSLTNTTTGFIEVRPFRIRVGTVAATEGDTVLVPIYLEDPSAYGVVSAELTFSWYYLAADFLGLETVGTTAAAAGWATPIVTSGQGQASVVMAGASSLATPGAVVMLRMVVHSTFSVTPGPGIFNEIYQALPVAGTVSVTALPNLSMNPSSAQLLVGDTQAFSVLGGATPPITWSVDDPLIASVDATGLLTALAEGVVHVRAQDALGDEVTSLDVTVCALALPSLGVSITAPDTVLVPVTVDRGVTGLGLYSYELGVSYPAGQLEFLGAESVGTISQGWGAPVVMDTGGTLTIVHAGGSPLTGCAPALLYLRFRSFSGTGTPSLTQGLFNEGRPCVRINQRSACSYTTAAPVRGRGLYLWPAQPNPFNPSTRIAFDVERAGQVEILIYSSRGRIVRRLVDGWFAPGRTHRVEWNGRDDSGQRASSGVYFVRLRQGQRVRLEKLTMLK